MMRIWILLVLFPFSVLADPSLECSDASSQVEIGACVQETGERVEAALNIALDIAQGAANELDEVTGRAAAVPALAAAQSAWLAYRDAQCEAVGASYGGGSGTGIAIASCRIELTRDRIETLIQSAN